MLADKPDPPSAQSPSIPEGGIPFHQAQPPNEERPPSRMFPRGKVHGPPGGGGRGPPNRGFPDGGGPMVVGAPGNNKLIENPPTIFTGDQMKTKEFLMQWELYRGVNANTRVMFN